MCALTDEQVKRFVCRFAREYFDLETLDLSQVRIEAKGGYCDWYVAVDARPQVADIAYFLVDQVEGRLQVSGVEY